MNSLSAQAPNSGTNMSSDSRGVISFSERENFLNTRDNFHPSPLVAANYNSPVVENSHIRSSKTTEVKKSLSNQSTALIFGIAFLLFAINR